MNEVRSSAAPINSLVWEKLLERAVAHPLPGRDPAAVRATLVPALVNLMLGRADAIIAASAEGYAQRPLLYVGTSSEELPAALLAAGHAVTVWDLYDQLHEIPESDTGQFAMIILSSLAYGVYSELSNGASLVPQLLRRLAPDGAFIVDQTDWDSIGYLAQTVHDTTLAIDGVPVAAQIGWDHSAESDFVTLYGHYHHDAKRHGCIVGLCAGFFSAQTDGGARQIS